MALTGGASPAMARQVVQVQIFGHGEMLGAAAPSREAGIGREGGGAALVEKDDTEEGSTADDEVGSTRYYHPRRRTSAQNAANSVGGPATIINNEGARVAIIRSEGKVKIAFSADNENKKIDWEEKVKMCEMSKPTWVCMERHGSYGARRLRTVDAKSIDSLGAWRPDWMSHPDVQSKRVFDLTWPGSHESGAYAADEKGTHTGETSTFGVLTQHLGIFDQLRLGVRAIEVQVGVVNTTGDMYAANGRLITPLALLFAEINKFLDQYNYEVVVINARKARTWGAVTLSHVQVLVHEEGDTSKVPGFSVHAAVDVAFSSKLATHVRLTALPATSTYDNPSISDLIKIGVRVIYFWEGQQVLCIDQTSCVQQPGWVRGPPPLLTKPQLSQAQLKIYQPACIYASDPLTRSDDATNLIMKLKTHVGNLTRSAHEFPVNCQVRAAPLSGAPPQIHSPPLLYEADAWMWPQSKNQEAYQHAMLNTKAIYTHGEPVTIRSQAERLNFLALIGFMRKRSRPLFTMPNIISFDYINPILVHRIIEAMQNRTECGYAIHCADTDSCWALSLLAHKSTVDIDNCMTEDEALAKLKMFADERKISWFWKMALLLIALCCKFFVLAGCCWMCGYDPVPTITGGQHFKDGTAGVGFVWFRRRRLEEAAAAAVAAPAIVDEGDQERQQGGPQSDDDCQSDHY